MPACVSGSAYLWIIFGLGGRLVVLVEAPAEATVRLNLESGD
jgi:hypothetical protein